ncbi:MAG: MerR family transcriptional regulator [Acidobacteria bacterium]|nr:MAG: MerR family transcriptional regulator [Acidobacteriota bacterium]
MSRNADSLPTRRDHAPLTDVSIPDKLYFRIGEVSDLARTKPYVLRFWETEFPTLKPVKSRSGHRLYRRQDVETILEIRRLLYEKGFTIEGARKQLAGDGSPRRGAEKPDGRGALDGQQLKVVKRELQAILTILSRKC